MRPLVLLAVLVSVPAFACLKVKIIRGAPATEEPKTVATAQPKKDPKKEEPPPRSHLVQRLKPCSERT